MKILVVAGLASSLVNFRGPLIRAMAGIGHEVHAAAPDVENDEMCAEKFSRWCIKGHNAPFKRASMNPLENLIELFSIIRLLRKLRPDVIFAYTIKPVLWGMIAAKICRVPARYALITGLGYSFTSQATGKRWLANRITTRLYRLALRDVSKVFFQNPDDAQLFRDAGIISQATHVIIVNGSGVDLAHYDVTPLPQGPVKFLLIARLLGDKGIREYAAAAAQIRQQYPDSEFHLVGGQDPNPDRISQEEIEQWQGDFGLIWHGPVQDVRPYIENCHVYVLPSYREGTPRTVLEAMAMGRPVITTDAPGCRETVKDGHNGFLVPPRSVEPLVEAMSKFLEKRDLVAEMGGKARQYCAEKYDVHKVNEMILREMGIIS